MVTLALAAAVAVLFAASRIGTRAGRQLTFDQPHTLEERYDLGDFYDATARALRSAESFQSAVWTASETSSGRLSHVLAAARARVERGGDFTAALERAAVELGDPAFSRYVDAAAICLPLGGPTATVFAVLAEADRSDRDVARELTSLIAPARLSAQLIASLPIAFVAFSAAIDPGVLSALLAWPLGIGCTAAGLSLDAIGFLWMRRTVDRARW